MKVKYKQLYSNDCGIAAIKNLLYVYKIKDNNNEIKIHKEGISAYKIKKVLYNYFKEVEVITFDIYQLKKVKNFKPFISLIKVNESSHYVVIYKKTKNYIYILDSLFDVSYKMTYENFKKIDGNISIVVDNKSSILINNGCIYYKIVLITLSFIESLFMLSTTVLIQQIIDNGIFDAVLFCLIQLIMLLIGKFKIKLFLKDFKILDDNLICNTMYKIYNLNYSYIKNHNIDEIYYRLTDAYTLKSLKLNFYYNIINDIILFILSFLLMFFYSFFVGIGMTIICFIIFIYVKYVFKNNKELLENKRIKEYEFFNTYRDSFKDYEKIYKSKNKSYYEKSLRKLKELQASDYSYEKYQLNKNYTFLFIQSVLICLVVLLYFTKLFNYLSVGSLIALINLINIILQPFLNICSNITFYSNHKLIVNRLDEINKSHFK